MSQYVWDTAKVDEYIRRFERGEWMKGDSPFDMNYGCWARKKNIPFDMSPEEIEEWTRCASSLEYFIDTYCQVMTDEGVRPLTLRSYQRDLIKHIEGNQMTALLHPRRVGVTMIYGLYTLWYSLFNFDKNTVLVANTIATTGNVDGIIKRAYQNIPYFLKAGIMNWNATGNGIRFDNGCRVLKTSDNSNMALGFQVHRILMQDAAYYNQDKFDSFLRSTIPGISSCRTSKMVIASTPKGTNKFFQIWRDSQDGRNKFTPHQINWWDVPGRDESWKERELSCLGQEAFDREYGNKFFTINKG